MDLDVEPSWLNAAQSGFVSWDPEQGGLLIASFLSEQGDLSAVERFTQFHDRIDEPLQERYYSALIPASPPGPGQQLAFEVDLDRCSGCKACVAACHALNGLDENEAWREVGLLVGGTAKLPVLQHVTTACHHCLDPACLSACPVNAYEKDPITGIVKHLDDQCFGCQYCTLACPYDVPKFHAGKGIVRKCDMCGDRLKAGEAPACVQACPHEAIRIRVVDVEDVSGRAAAGDFLPGAFDPSYTRPSTRYRSLRPGALVPADAYQVDPEHAHAPLVIMLVLTQLSVGGFLIEFLTRLNGPGSHLNLLLSLGIGYAGLTASLLHLGRPLLAYRAILGLRHSWLSREVLAFGLFAKTATAFVAADFLLPGWPRLRFGLLATTVIAGLCGVGCSVMVYHVVRRPFWRASIGGVKFLGTTVVLGLATSLAALGFTTADARVVPVLAASLMIATVAKLAFEARDLQKHDEEPLRRTAWLLDGPLRRSVGLRVFLGGAWGLLMPALAIVAAFSDDHRALAVSAALALAATIGGELIERSLFFRAVTRPKMPGGLPA